MSKIVKPPANLDARELSDLDNAFELADNIVTKNYLSKLTKCNIIEPDKDFLATPLENSASIFKIEKIVYNKDENNLQKLISVYASSLGTDSNIVMIIDSDGISTDLYLGTTGATEVSSARGSAKSLMNNFLGNYPGSLNEGSAILDNKPLNNLIDRCTGNSFSSVASVSGVASIREKDDVDNQNYVQGIEKMIDTMQGVPFSAIFIATRLSNELLEDIQAEYELLYAKLAPFAKSELTFNESSSDGVTKTLSESLSTTLSTNTSSALSVGTSESKAHTKGESIGHTDTIGGSVGMSSGAIPGPSVSTNYSHSISRNKNWSDTTTFGTTKNQTDTIGESEAVGEIKSIADGTTTTETTGRSLQISYKNKTVEVLLEKIDEQLKRIKEGQNYGIFGTAAYFLASTSFHANMAASSYKGLINGNSTNIETSYINFWDDKRKVKTMKSYLRKLSHPVFSLNKSNHITPASIVSGRELAVQMSLPRKSTLGISVLDTANFGRNILSDTTKPDKYIPLGNLYHMGREELGVGGKIPVQLDANSLTMHTFITGSTGSGKSNAIYSIIEKVLERNKKYKKNVHFMVIEPAKGEYKNKFGHRDDVRVLGTNSKKTELLRINPFSFPEDIHVLEHIDKLIEIFNVCWPMYAAMPAVLKDAVERAYMSAGWNLSTSECKYKSKDGNTMYPCFADVLIQINIVINESQYSADSKGDYSGALCTRIKSLTNGLYGQIFTADELTSKELYDKNVIVDLSRVGSIETKALIMGLLVMKMQEYRMASNTESNSELNHLTILEEAHNLLKKTSSEQSSDSSNLLGKSVEMLANSIAEMRTYGEGFIIADQSPGLLDMSVIRNTNTKIILRLPDISDRELVGKAASLNDDQILELSRLKTGVAAVYQNNWLEPILCKIFRCEDDEAIYIKGNNVDGSTNYIDDLVNYIMLPCAKKMEVDTNFLKKIEDTVYKLQTDSITKSNILAYIKAESVDEIQSLRNKIVYGVFNSETAITLSNFERNNISSWRNKMFENLEPNISSFDPIEQDKILAIIANEHVQRLGSEESVKMFDDLMRHLSNR